MACVYNHFRVLSKFQRFVKFHPACCHMTLQFVLLGFMAAGAVVQGLRSMLRSDLRPSPVREACFSLL